MASTIDLYRSPSNPVVDITGQLLGIDLFFANNGSSIQTDHALETFLPFLGLKQAELNEIESILSTPLSTYFDNAWTVNHISLNFSVVDIVVSESRPPPHPHPPPPPHPPPTARNAVEQLIWGYLAKASGEDYVIQNNYNLATTGTLRSVIYNNTKIFLAYDILGNFSTGQFLPILSVVPNLRLTSISFLTLRLTYLMDLANISPTGLISTSRE
jgi:hypothetical protein